MHGCVSHRIPCALESHFESVLSVGARNRSLFRLESDGSIAVLALLGAGDCYYEVVVRFAEALEGGQTRELRDFHGSNRRPFHFIRQTL